LGAISELSAHRLLALSAIFFYDWYKKVLTIFIGTFAALGSLAPLAFFIIKDGKLKQKLWYVDNIAIWFLFLLFVYLMDGLGYMFLVAFLGVTLITILNLGTIKVCSSCGKMTKSRSFASKPKSCRKCGAKFEG
jgi:hypothetical protein